jgi:hypothetical protein
MAYNTANPPLLKGDQPIAIPRFWGYYSTHTQLEVGTSDFISNGSSLGMLAGDTVLVTESTTFDQSLHTVRVVGATYVSLSVGQLISSAS